MDHVITTTDADFEQTVLQTPGFVAVHFWAPRSAPSRVVVPFLEELAGEFADQILIAKVNTAEHQRWASLFGVMAMPTLIFFKDGVECGRGQGAAPKRTLRDLLSEVLGY